MTPKGYRRLILTRHAKSAWDDPRIEDHDRPLNARGRRAARSLGDWLASRGYDPEEVLCSTATRTRDTWDLVARAVFETRPELHLCPDLYLSSAEVMRQVLAKASAPTVMMIGHNPGIAELARELCARPPLSAEFARYPTTATVVLDFHADRWADIRPGEGSVLDFVRFDGRA